MPDDLEFRWVNRKEVLVASGLERGIVARRLDEVPRALQQLDEGVARGLHAAGFICYEAAPALDPCLAAHEPGDVPLLCFGLFRRLEPSPRALFPHAKTPPLSWQSLVTPAEYRQKVRCIQQWIAAGDTYQVNYTFPLAASFRGDPRQWFEQLCVAQDAEYGCYMRHGDSHLAGASPELFFRLQDGVLTTRPMKGTRRRGRGSADDLAMATELRGSLKDRAENAMIVDLLRNDMGRVSAVGSVKVETAFEIERLPTVWQMTSTINSATIAGVPRILRALFPCGSVTGAPKIRTMQLIRNIERFRRGVYCGCAGWWSPGGRAEFNVAIRTAWIDGRCGSVRYHVGSGITSDSDPDAEWEECQAKARVLNAPAPQFELLETLRCENEIVLFEEHLSRLRGSAEYFGFPLDLSAVRAALLGQAKKLASETAHRLRLLVGRTGEFRIEVAAAPGPQTLRLGFARQPIDASNVFLYHKTTHREHYRQALNSRPDCSDVLLWNERGEITESTLANVILTIEGERFTPPVACGLLPGTRRQYLLASGAIREKVLLKTDLRRAEAVVLVNSLRGTIPIQWMEA